MLGALNGFFENVRKTSRLCKTTVPKEGRKMSMRDPQIRSRGPAHPLVYL